MLIQSCGCSLHMGGKSQRKARSYVDHQGKHTHVFTKLLSEQYWLKLRINSYFPVLKVIQLSTTGFKYSYIRNSPVHSMHTYVFM